MVTFGQPDVERKMIESTYEDICKISRYQDETVDFITKSVPVVVAENVICALSQSGLNPTTQTDSANNINYNIKLFLAPEIKINPGDQIEVLRFGKEYLFESSGEPMVYATHQEVILVDRRRA